MNTRLNNKIVLHDKVAIYVPCTINVNEVIDNTSYVNIVACKLASLFGGSTIQRSQGCYIDSNGKNVMEDTTIVYAYYNVNNEAVDSILDVAEWLKAEMKQECIGLELYKEFYLI